MTVRSSESLPVNSGLNPAPREFVWANVPMKTPASRRRHSRRACLPDQGRGGHREGAPPARHGGWGARATWRYSRCDSYRDSCRNSVHKRPETAPRGHFGRSVYTPASPRLPARLRRFLWCTKGGEACPDAESCSSRGACPPRRPCSALTLRRLGVFVKRHHHDGLGAFPRLLARGEPLDAPLGPLEPQDGPEGLLRHEQVLGCPVGVHLARDAAEQAQNGPRRRERPGGPWSCAWARSSCAPARCWSGS